MASLNYEDVFNQFLGEVTDHDLLSLNDSDASELMTGWLHKSVAEPLIRKMFSSFSIDDDIQEISYEMNYATDEQSDELFVKEVLAKQMAYVWANTQLMSDVNSKQMFGGKETRYFSQSAHIVALQSMKTEAMNDVRRMIGDYSISNNGYLGGS